MLEGAVRPLAMIAGLWLSAPTFAHDEPAPVLPEVRLGSSWSIVEENRDELILRHQTSPDGVRIVLALTAQGRQAGVSPIVDGHTYEVRRGDQIVPMLAWPWPEHPVRSLIIEEEGPDLLIRLSGPALHAVTDHPDAPDDPTLSWTRIRPRGTSWRIALTGVHRWTLPQVGRVEHRGQDRVLHSGWGSFEVRTDARAVRSAATGGSLVWDTRPSIELAQPYPKTGMTWRPSDGPTP